MFTNRFKLGTQLKKTVHVVETISPFCKEKVFRAVGRKKAQANSLQEQEMIYRD